MVITPESTDDKVNATETGIQLPIPEWVISDEETGAGTHQQALAFSDELKAWKGETIPPVPPWSAIKTVRSEDFSNEYYALVGNFIATLKRIVGDDK